MSRALLDGCCVGIDEAVALDRFEVARIMIIAPTSIARMPAILNPAVAPKPLLYLIYL